MSLKFFLFLFTRELKDSNLKHLLQDLTYYKYGANNKSRECPEKCVKGKLQRKNESHIESLKKVYLV